MARQVHVQYGPIEGVGSSLTAAKADALTQLTTLAEQVHDGLFFGYIRQCSCVIWPTQDGWTYYYLLPDEPQIPLQRRWSLNGTYATREEAERQLRRHLIQAFACSPDVSDEEFGLWLKEIHTPGDRDEFIRYRRWHLAYRQLRNAGHSELEACRLASVEAYD